MDTNRLAILTRVRPPFRKPTEEELAQQLEEANRKHQEEEEIKRVAEEKEKAE